MDSNKRPETMERITTMELAKAFIDELPQKFSYYNRSGIAYRGW